MTKKLFSIHKRANTLLDYAKEQGINVSAFVSDAVVDEVLPVYSSLRVEALYLLDLWGEDAKSLRGTKLKNNDIIDPFLDLDYTIRQSLSRGVMWLMRGHRIRNKSVLEQIIFRFQTNTANGGKANDRLNEYVLNLKSEMEKKLKEIDSSYQGFNDSLGGVAQEVLRRWEQLWNEEISYQILSMCILCENLISKIEVMEAIFMLQALENQFILEVLNEG